MTNKSTSTVNKKVRARPTALGIHIAQKLTESNQSWSKMVTSCGLPKSYITRIKHGWIPPHEICTDIANFFHEDWWDYWVLAGHVKRADIDRLKRSPIMYSWRLNAEEAEIIGSFRECTNDSYNYLTAAVRGAARATQNKANPKLIRQHKVHVLLELDFVNDPVWTDMQRYPKVMRTTIQKDGKDLEVYVFSEENDFGYLAQSTVSGTLRYAVTGEMSPLPDSIFRYFREDHPYIDEDQKKTSA